MNPGHGSVSVALAGSGGAGVMTAGNILLEAAAQAGYYSLMTRTSGPQIRGGEAAAMVRVCTFPTDAQDDRFAVLAAIDWQNVGPFAAEIPLGASSLIVGDPAQGEPPEPFLKSGARYLPVPLKALAKQIGCGWPNMATARSSAICCMGKRLASGAIRPIAARPKRSRSTLRMRRISPIGAIAIGASSTKLSARRTARNRRCAPRSSIRSAS